MTVNGPIRSGSRSRRNPAGRSASPAGEKNAASARMRAVASPGVDGQIGVGLREQAVVVEVPVRDHDAEQRRVGAVGEPRHGGQRHRLAGRGRERAAEVEQEPPPLGLQLDAVAADLARAAVDADPQPARRRRACYRPRSQGCFSRAR